MPKQVFTNNASSVLTVGVNTTFTTLTVTDGSMFPTPTGGDYFDVALIGLNVNGQEASWEIARCTARSGNNLTVTRAQEGTVGATWGVGTRVEERMTAGFGNLVSVHLGDVANPHAVTASQVGLGNVTNTSDANKPVSTAQQTALDLKANLVSPVMTGVPAAPTATAGTNTTQLATTAFVRTEVTNVINAAPAALDTLNELAAALGNDAAFSTTVTNSLALKEVASNKNASGGYAGLTLFKLNLRNAANTITSWFTTAATVARTWTLPDKDGTIAMTSDITGTNSGTNTGDNSANSLYSGLVTNATHTGDATGSGALTVVKINGTLMSGLGTGILKNTTGTGVPSIAVAGDFPTLNQSTTGNAATASNLGATQLNATALGISTFAAAADWTKPTGYQAMLGASGSNGLPAGHGQSYFGYNVTSRRDSSNGWSGTLTAFDNSNMWFTYQKDGTALPSAWRKVLHDGNYNTFSPTLTGGGASGSWGITATNATQLGGVAAASYAQLASPSLTGHISMYASGANLPASTTMAAATSNTGALEIASQGTAGTAGASFLSFHRPGSYAVHLGLDTDNKVKVGGWSMGAVAYELWHAGNDGAGSGLDADLLDGQQGSYYAPINTPIFTNATDSIVTSAGSNGYGSFYAKGSGTNYSYHFFGNVTTGETGRITSENGTGLSIGTGTGGIVQLRIPHTASAVNYLQATGSATGNRTTVSAAGTDANVGINYAAKGSEFHVFSSGGGTNLVICPAPASAVNYLYVYSGATGTGPTLFANGTDTNVSFNLTTKGSGVVNINGNVAYHAGNLVAGTNYVAPTGSDGTVTRQMFKDIGYVYYDSTTTNALDYVNGQHQRWAPNTGAQTLSITNWPPTGNLGELLIAGVNLGAATITWPTINWVKSDGSFTTTFSSNGVTLQSSGTDFVLLWTRDAGTTIYGKVVR